MNRILVIGYLPKINGISTSVLNVYRNIDRTQFQYEFLIAGTKKEMSPDLEEILSLGGKLHYMDYDKYNFPKSCHRKLEKLMLSIPNMCGVHVHDLNMMSYPLYLADRLGYPVKVIHCHTAPSKSDLDGHKHTRSFMARLRMIKGPQFDRIACSDLAGQYDYPGLTFDVIPNGVDIDRFSYNETYRQVLRTKCKIKDDTCVVGFVANLHNAKNPLFAIKIFQEFHKLNPNSHFFILGSGTESAKAHKYIEENNMSDIVTFFGSKYDVDMFYSAMDLVIQPSLSEGLPNSLIEAQANGLPCLISDEISDMIRITPLIESFSLKDAPILWAKKLAKMSQQNIDRNRWKNQIIKSGYDIGSVSKKIMSLYTKRIETHGDSLK